MNKNLTKLEKSWVLYDVANSAFTMMVSTIIPIIFKSNATNSGIALSSSTAIWSYSLSFSTLMVALLGPFLGRKADSKDKKKKYFLTVIIIGFIGCLTLGFSNLWIVYLCVFVVTKIAYSISLVFYDSMLIDITSDDRSDEISSLGYGWGYIGSCVPFIVVLLLFLKGESIGLSFYSISIISFSIVGLWWFLLSTPLLKNYQQKYFSSDTDNNFKETINGLLKTFKIIFNNKPVFLFILAYFFYIDGVYTIIELSTTYGMDVGIGSQDLLLALLLTQVVAFPSVIIFGKLSKKIKTKSLLKICVFAYILIVLYALQLDKAIEFWILAVCVAIFQGSIQALSRSYYSRLIPKEHSNEYFGIFDIFGKGAAFSGTLIVGVITQLTKNSKFGVAGLLVLLIIGFIILNRLPKTSADN